MTLFNELKSIALKRAQETKDGKYPLFQHYTNDLYEIDSDILENDSQRGDVYVWALRGNGCGTDFNRFGTKSFNDHIRLAPEGSEFYLVQCTGVNEGSVIKIDREYALSLEDLGFKVDRNRTPRREFLYDKLDKTLGLDRNESLSKTIMGSEFSPNKGDITAIKISDSGNQVAIDLVRVKTFDEDGKPKAPSKPSVRYYAQRKGLKEFDFGKPRYLAIHSQRGGYATFKDISQKDFEKALADVKKQPESEYQP